MSSHYSLSGTSKIEIETNVYDLKLFFRFKSYIGVLLILHNFMYIKETRKNDLVYHTLNFDLSLIELIKRNCIISNIVVHSKQKNSTIFSRHSSMKCTPKAKNI